MTTKELFNICNDESEKILKIYLEIMFKHSSTSSSLEPAVSIYEMCSDDYLAYLITITMMLNKEFAQLCKEEKVTIRGNRRIEKEVSLLEKEYNDINKSSLYYEKYFNYCMLTKCLICTGIEPNQSTIVIERILYNLFKENSGYDASLKFNHESFLNKLEKLAVEKESIITKRTIPFRKIRKSQYYGIGEILTGRTYDYDPLIGRGKEFRKFCASIMDREKSVIVYGLPGVGKTTLVKGLAYRIQRNDISVGLKDKRIIKISGTELISGDGCVGDVEQSVQDLICEVKKDEDNILFIDEIHTLIGLGAGSKSNNDVSNMLKESLGEGEIKIIGATTPQEYKLIQSNGAFSRRFIPVEVGSLIDKEILYILNVTVDRFQEVEGIGFTFDENTKNKLLRTVLEISKEKYQDSDIRYNPDAALTLLRSGCNYCKLDGKKNLTIDYMIEGIENSSLVNQSGIEYFKENTKQFRKMV